MIKQNFTSFTHINTLWLNSHVPILDKKISLVNGETFDTAFANYYTPLVLFANNYVNNDQSISEDIVQDVFLKLLQKKYSFDSLSSLKAYLYKSIKNACINYIKHEKVKQLYVDEEKNIKISETNFLDQVLEEEVYFHLIKALENLPNRCKEVFKLSIEGLKNPEIATKMDISVETVKSQKKRGKKILKKLLKPYILQLLMIFVSD